MASVYSPAEMAREYQSGDSILFGQGGCWTTTAEAAFRLDDRLVTFDRERGAYRRACLYKRDEVGMISAALAARPTRSPAIQHPPGNRLR